MIMIMILTITMTTKGHSVLRTDKVHNTKCNSKKVKHKAVLWKGQCLNITSV